MAVARVLILPVFFLTLLFAYPLFSVHADAALSITNVVAEVPGANATHQWIQVMNTGSDAIDLGAKDIRLVDHTGKHEIKSYAGSSTTITPGETLVLAQNPATYLVDHPAYSGVVLKSAFTLTDVGTVSIIQTDGATLATRSYAQTAPKPFSSESSSIKRASHSSKSSATKSKSSKKYSSQSSYDSGTVAPTATADAAAAGARPSLDASFAYIGNTIVPFISALASSIWFALFLGLLAFSGFSLIVIESQQRQLQCKQKAV